MTQTPRSLPLPILANLSIAEPCPLADQAWQPGQRTRHCAECDLDVHNFSELTAVEAAALVTHSRETGTRLCASFQKDASGNIITADSRPPRNEEPSPLTRPQFLTRLLATLGILSVPLALAACAARAGGKVAPNSEGRMLGALRVPDELRAEAIKAAQAEREAEERAATEQLAESPKLMGGAGRNDDGFFTTTDEPDPNRYFGGTIQFRYEAPSDTPTPQSPGEAP